MSSGAQCTNYGILLSQKNISWNQQMLICQNRIHVKFCDSKIIHFPHCADVQKQIKNHTWFHGIFCRIVRVKFCDFYTVWPTYCTIYRSQNLKEYTPPALIAWVLASLIVTVWKTEKFTLTWRKLREINEQKKQKQLISRNFCWKKRERSKFP